MFREIPLHNTGWWGHHNAIVWHSPLSVQYTHELEWKIVELGEKITFRLQLSTELKYWLENRTDLSYSTDCMVKYRKADHMVKLSSSMKLLEWNNSQERNQPLASVCVCVCVYIEVHIVCYIFAQDLGHICCQDACKSAAQHQTCKAVKCNSCRNVCLCTVLKWKILG